MVAKLAVNSTVETAFGEGNKTIYNAKAESSTIQEVINAQSKSYKFMKSNFTAPYTLDNDALFKYMQHTLIKDYSTGKVAMQIEL